VVNASVTYKKKQTLLGGSYLHDSNGGSGYLLGATVDNAQGNFQHHFGQVFTLGLTGGYGRTVALANNQSIAGGFGAAQGTWQLGRLILFANYTGTGQSASSTLPGNVLNQTLNSFSLGFGLSSREARVRQP
jgi:hypothetical protein